jgi:carboxymethylenebutenolidase
MIRTEANDDAPVHGTLFHAERPRGGIIILPTVTGIDAFMQAKGREFAEAGISALVFNTYPHEALPADVVEGRARAAKLPDDIVDAMSQSVGYMLTALKLPRVAVLGFCLGGRYAVLLAAQDHRLAACMAFYPSIVAPRAPNHTRDALALAAQIPCPVHVTWGTNDAVISRETFLALRETLERRAAATKTQYHPDAVHSFMRPDLQSVAANASAAKLSWPQATAFLNTCLQSA